MAPKKAKKKAKKKVKKKAAKKAAPKKPKGLKLSDYIDMLDRAEGLVSDADSLQMTGEGAASDAKTVCGYLNNLVDAIEAMDQGGIAEAATKLRSFKSFGDIRQLDDGDGFVSELQDLLGEF